MKASLNWQEKQLKYRMNYIVYSYSLGIDALDLEYRSQFCNVQEK